MTVERPTTTVTASDRRRWLGLALLGLPTTLLTLDITVLNLAMSAITADLGADPVERLWIVDVYGFLIAAFLIPMGRLGDRIGRRRLLLIGAAVFALASAVAAFGGDPATLIAARAVLGVAGATLMPATLALISTMFPEPTRRRQAIAVWATCFSLGGALGPIVGGVLLEVAWWGAVFLLAVPVMLILVVAGPLLLPEVTVPGGRGVDLISVGQVLVGMLVLVYSVKRIAEDGLGGLVLPGLVLGGLLLTLFVRRQRRLADPLVDPGLLSGRSTGTALLALAGGLGVLGGLYYLFTQHLRTVEGLSPLEAGLWLLPAALGTVVTSLVSAPLAARLGAWTVLGGGLAVSAGGAMLLASAVGAGSVTAVAGFTLCYLGTGPLSALGTDLVVRTVPTERAGSAGAVSETAMELGFAVGIALLGSIAAVLAGSEQGAAGGPASASVLSTVGWLGAGLLVLLTAAVFRAGRRE